MNNNENDVMVFGKPIDIPEEKLIARRNESRNLTPADLFEMALQSDSDWGKLEKDDIRRYTACVPPDQQKEIRRILEKEYNRQQKNLSENLG